MNEILFSPTKSADVGNVFYDILIPVLQECKNHGFSNETASLIHENIFFLLFASMDNNPLVQYHNLSHVISIFEFAEHYDIKLNREQKLAILFHDSIYNFGSSKNEEHSSLFFKSLMGDFLDKESIDKVSEMIMGTAKHMEPNVFSDEVSLIMDLDVSAFAWDNEARKIVNSNLMSEFKTNGVTDEECQKGRLNFLKAFLSKGFVFRTKQMQFLETVAIKNVQEDIKELL